MKLHRLFRNCKALDILIIASAFGLPMGMWIAWENFRMGFRINKLGVPIARKGMK